jgi:DNA repair protein RadC
MKADKKYNFKIKLLQVKESTGDKITMPQDVAVLMKEEAKADRECFWILHFNNANKLIEKELVHMGTMTSSLVHPREVFRKAISNNAVTIMTIHNHPSGNCEPSKDDYGIWRRLNEAGKILGIPVMDNLITTPQGSFYSQKSRGEL